MIDLRCLAEEEIEAAMEETGFPRWRGRQIFEWLNAKKALNFSELSNIPKALKDKISPYYGVSAIALEKKLGSVKDDTTKYLFTLENSVIIESVLMRQSYGNTVCVSSQAGCNMGCKFCASALGKERDLTSGEMAAQVYAIERDAGERVTNVVIMGMGEPLENYENSVKFIKTVSAERGANISQRNITLSTCGLIGGIKRLMGEGLKITLAVSLHAPSDEIRREIMPVAKSNPLGELLAVSREYAEITGRRVTFEYALIKGVNDSRENAAELARKLKGALCHVNLIPLNAVPALGYEGSAAGEVKKFAEILTNNGVPATVRKERGADINGACGQLKKQLKMNDKQ